VDPVPDPLLLRKSGSAGNQTQDLRICSQKLWPLDHRGGLIGLPWEILVDFWCKINRIHKTKTISAHSLRYKNCNSSNLRGAVGCLEIRGQEHSEYFVLNYVSFGICDSPAPDKSTLFHVTKCFLDTGNTNDKKVFLFSFSVGWWIYGETSTKLHWQGHKGKLLRNIRYYHRFCNLLPDRTSITGEGAVTDEAWFHAGQYKITRVWHVKIRMLSVSSH
jgi:hypothetical protein